MLAQFSMAGRRALVSGASLSIGRSIALGFAEQGATIAIHYSAAADAALGQPDAAQATLAGHRAVAAAAAGLGGVDILVVCASVQSRTPFLEVTDEEMQHQFQINFRATVQLLQAALPPMKAQGWGRVLTIGSVNQVRPEPELAIYAALKSAQHNLCFNLAKQYAPFNVMINNLSPGLVRTERNRWRRENAEAWRAIEAMAGKPIGRAAEPDEMVGAAVLLCSDAASYIAGTDLMVTGGGHLPLI
jgi:NAD(P)-dependent dehydrogenase (short-subunit alcohol dehydrogenase family)